MRKRVGAEVAWRSRSTTVRTTLHICVRFLFDWIAKVVELRSLIVAMEEIAVLVIIS